MQAKSIVQAQFTVQIKFTVQAKSTVQAQSTVEANTTVTVMPPCKYTKKRDLQVNCLHFSSKT